MSDFMEFCIGYSIILGSSMVFLIVLLATAWFFDNKIEKQSTKFIDKTFGISKTELDEKIRKLDKDLRDFGLPGLNIKMTVGYKEARRMLGGILKDDKR